AARIRLASGAGLSRRRSQKGPNVNLELTGKTALVTGGSQGIGRAIAFGLAAEGARVAICARDKARLEQTADEVKAKTRAEVLVLPGDLSRLDDVNRVAAAARDWFGRLDILINNAGAIRGGDFLKIPDEQWAGDWSLKILGYVRMARAVFPMMQA
ncbi:MAG: short-chain dehydrogenase, partial [Candidatus Rokuibacteriota bacterium]